MTLVPRAVRLCCAARLTVADGRLAAPASALSAAEHALSDEPVAGRTLEDGAAAAGQVDRGEQHVRVIQRQQRTLYRLTLRQRARPTACRRGRRGDDGVSEAGFSFQNFRNMNFRTR